MNVQYQAALDLLVERDQQIAQLKARITELEAERDEWRAKAGATLQHQQDIGHAYQSRIAELESLLREAVKIVHCHARNTDKDWLEPT